MPERQHVRYRSLMFVFGAAAVLGVGLLTSAPAAIAVPSTEAVDAIHNRYTEFGGATSLLGAPVGEPADVPGGAQQDYSGGAILYSDKTGAKVMYGAILEKYQSLGGPGSGLGFPLNDETDVGDGVGRFNDFSEAGGAAIYWTPQSGAWTIKGKVLDAWRVSGATAGPFGYPSADTAEVNGVSTAKFVGPGGTEIRWSDNVGLATVPPALAASIPGFNAVGTTAEGTVAVSTPEISASPAPSVDVSTGGGFKWWPVVIGLALAALVAGLLAMLGRRRRTVPVPVARTPHVPTPQVPPPHVPRPPVQAASPPRRVVEPPRIPEPSVAPAVPLRPQSAPPPERPRAVDGNGNGAAHRPPERPKPVFEEPHRPAFASAAPKVADALASAKLVAPVVEEKSAPLLVNYDDSAANIGGIEVTYENNAVGDHQESREDKSDSV